MIVNSRLEQQISEMVRLRDRWGKNAGGRFSIHELESMVTYLYEHRDWLQENTVSKDQYNLAVRQLTAAKARLAKYEKQKQTEEQD